MTTPFLWRSSPLYVSSKMTVPVPPDSPSYTRRPGVLRCVVMIVAAAVVSCFCLQRAADSWIPSAAHVFPSFDYGGSPSSDSEEYSLERVLKDASMQDNSVILTTLNEAWAAPNSVIDLFLESFRIGEQTRYLLNHLVIVSLDGKAFLGVWLCTPIVLLSSLKELTFHEVMWFRDPFPHFHPDADFQIACDHFRGRSDDIENRPNGGFKFHPDDANQAYFPKFVVVLGLSIAAISILMLPADVANRQACRHSIYNGACSLTLPMKDLWLAVYIVDALLVFFVIPFAMFYYEGDLDKTVWKRMKSALLWVIVTAVVCALLLGILYGLIGKVDFTVRHLSSSTVSFPSSWDFSSGQQCIGNGAKQCSAYTASASSETTWTMRSTFPEYVVALATIVGSVLFTELLLLEEDVKALEEMYPQGEQAEATWAMTVLGYLAKLVLGVIGLIVSVAWIAHIVIYLLIDPPLSPFLNEVFIKLDGVWGLLGTAAFAFFCFYLLLAVVAGAMMLGLKLVFITIHPMKYNVFQIAFIILAGLTFVYYSAFPERKAVYGVNFRDGKEESLVADCNFLHEHVTVNRFNT
ncbi:UNVERIFIED_CONTAM: LIMR family protein [Sesamum radiatum]|uniref:LIMR family protein n=1 Tax=Sesamum radiatum TaxID=300843 RepID=A0AAW2KUC3_SESRA